MADSADTTAERERVIAILAKIMGHPSKANFSAAFKAIKNGTAANAFTPPDQHQ